MEDIFERLRVRLELNRLAGEAVRLRHLAQPFTDRAAIEAAFYEELDRLQIAAVFTRQDRVMLRQFGIEFDTVPAMATNEERKNVMQQQQFETTNRSHVLRAEVDKLTSEVTELQSRADTAGGRLAGDIRKLEEAEVLVILGQAKKSDVYDLRQRVADARMEAEAVPRLLSQRKQELEAKRRELAAAVELEGRLIKQERRAQVLKLRSNFLTALAEFIDGAAAKGVESEVNDWTVGENQSQDARFAGCALTTIMDNLLSGRSDYLALMIGDLHKSEPALVTAAMENHLSRLQKRADERAAQRRRDHPLTAKEASRKLFESARREVQVYWDWIVRAISTPEPATSHFKIIT